MFQQHLDGYVAEQNEACQPAVDMLVFKLAVLFCHEKAFHESSHLHIGHVLAPIGAVVQVIC